MILGFKIILLVVSYEKKEKDHFPALVRENELSAHKTIPTRLTFGVQRTKKIVRITCETYLTA